MDPLEITSEIVLPDKELHWSFARSSGPGGQNVNKVNSKATLHWSVLDSESLPPAVRTRFLSRYGHRITADGQLVVTSQRFRDQLRNREDCRQKLRGLVLAVLKPPKTRRRTKPTRASRERRLQAKRQTSDKKRMRRGPSKDER